MCGEGGGEEGCLELLCAPAVNLLCLYFTHIAVQLRGKLTVCLFTMHALMHLCLSGME